MDFSELLKTLRESSTEAEWSQAVQVVRRSDFLFTKKNDDELLVRIRDSGRPLAISVNLWPEDCDWNCDIPDSKLSLIYSAAAVIAAKQKGTAALEPSPLKQAYSADSKKSGAKEVAMLCYRLVPTRLLSHERPSLQKFGEGLELQRVLVLPDAELPLPGSLRNYIGGVQAGRLKGPQVFASQEDSAIDTLLDTYRTGVLPSHLSVRLLPHLLNVDHLTDQNRSKLIVNTEIFSPQLELKEKQDGFILRLLDAKIYPASSLAIVGNELRPLVNADPSKLLAPVIQAIYQHGSFQFPRAQLGVVTTEIIPELESVFKMTLVSKSIFERVVLEPYLQIDLNQTATSSQTIQCCAHIFYGEPPLAEVTSSTLQLFSNTQAPIRRTDLEESLIQLARYTYQLQLGLPLQLNVNDAVKIVNIASDARLAGNFLPFSKPCLLKPTLTIQSIEQSVSSMDVATGNRDTEPTLFGDLNFVAENGRQIGFSEALTAFRNGEKLLFLGDGQLGELPLNWLTEYATQVEMLLAARKADGRIPKHLLPMAAVISQECSGDLNQNLLNLHAQLVEHRGLPPFVPPGNLAGQPLQGTLRGYQEQGAAWLQLLQKMDLGALLADDMGLGKTLQSLAVFRGRCLVVAPTSLLQTWKREAARFRPDLTTQIYWGANRQLDSQVQLTITTYGIMRIESSLLAQENWDVVVLDESQTIKNPQSQTAQAAFALHSKFRLALSGTPVENRPEELWSQMRFLNPELLPSLAQFKTEISSCTNEQMKGLARKIKPFILRRTKEEVAPELPKKTESVISVELSERERKLYDSLLLSTRREVVAELEARQTVSGQNRFKIFELLLRLRQACCHSGLVPGSNLNISAKLEALSAMLANITAEGHRALVFSQWTSLLDYLEPNFLAENISFTRLDGATRNRQQVIDQFQDKNGPAVLLVSLKAGGVGLTLTAADYVFFCDPWWNPAAEDQASDRTHRLGQDKPIFVYRLIATNTIEERIIELQEKKRGIAQALLEGDGSIKESLSADDIAFLLK